VQEIAEELPDVGKVVTQIVCPGDPNDVPVTVTPWREAWIASHSPATLVPAVAVHVSV